MANVSKLFGGLSSAEFKALDKKALAGVSIKNTENTLTARLDAQLASGKSEGIVGAVTNFGLGFKSIGGLDAVKNANAFRLATGMSATGAIGLAGAVGAGAGVVSGVMDGTGPIDGGLGGLATGVLASAAVVGGAVMTKQGRKVVDRIGRAKGGKIAERYNNRAGGFDGFAEDLYASTKGEGDQWTNFARGAYIDKSLGRTARNYKNPTFSKPRQAGSELGTNTQTTPLNQATSGANPRSVASYQRIKPDNPHIDPDDPIAVRQRMDLGGTTQKESEAKFAWQKSLAPSQAPASTTSTSVPTPTAVPTPASTRQGYSTGRKTRFSSAPQREEAPTPTQEAVAQKELKTKRLGKRMDGYKSSFIDSNRRRALKRDTSQPVATVSPVTTSSLNQQQRAEQTSNFFKKIRMNPGTVGNLGAQAAQQAGRADAEKLAQGVFTREGRQAQIARQEAARQQARQQTQRADNLTDQDASSIWNQFRS